MKFFKKILYKIKENEMKSIERTRQKILTLSLKNIENENDLLKILDDIQYMIISRLYYQKDKCNRPIFIKDLLFIENYLKEIDKDILLENKEVQEKISDLMYYIHN